MSRMWHESKLNKVNNRATGFAMFNLPCLKSGYDYATSEYFCNTYTTDNRKIPKYLN